MAAGRGVGKTEAAGVGGNAGVQAVSDLGGDFHPHLPQQIVHDLGGSRRVCIQQGGVGIAGVAGMMVDAQLDLIHILLQGIAEQLNACHVHCHHMGGGELALEALNVQIIILRGNGVVAQHRRLLVQRVKGPVQCRAAAQSVAVRVFMAQYEHIVHVTQPLRGLAQIQKFSHGLLLAGCFAVQGTPHGSPSAACYSSSPAASAGAAPSCRSASSWLMWAA